MKTLNRRRRFGAIAGALAAIGAGMGGLIGHHDTDTATNSRYWLIGLSVGVTVGVILLLLVKMRAPDGD